jgi:hypothetical protein
MVISQKLLYSSFIFFLLLLCTASCNTTEPPDPPVPPEPIFKLELEDVSCTEAWITLTTTDLILPAELTLKQYNSTGDSISKALILNTQDTLLYIDSLFPNQTYEYLVSSIPQSGGQNQATSNELSVTTMDTTSHNFTFQTWTFGTIGSSVFYDVAIIDENNIIAVGEIMVADSSPNGYTTYNAVHWDGNQWTLHQLYFITIQGRPDTGVYAAKSILAFDENNTWISSGSQITKWDENIQSFRHWNPVYVHKMWGTDNSNIYTVGYGGQIAHYNGTSWKKIESGTDLNINDIWGDYNEKTGEWEILAVASNYGTDLEKKILLIKDNVVINLPTSPQMWPLLTTWFIPNRQYYVAGAGIYQKKLLEDSLWKNNATDITTFSTTSIRGNDINDIIVVGAFGDFVHFNGVNWKNDYEEPLLANGSYTKVAIKNNLIVAVGSNQVSINSEAVILVGRR